MFYKNKLKTFSEDYALTTNFRPKNHIARQYTTS